MQTKVSDNGRRRETSDDLNPRLNLVEWKCTDCGEWVEDDEVVWVPNTDTGQAYCIDCVPEED